MLSNLIFHLYKKKENFDDTENAYLRKYIILFIIVVLIELTFIFYSLWCLFMLNLPLYYTLLIVIFMLIPDYGLLFSILVVVYYNCNLKKLKNKTQATFV